MEKGRLLLTSLMKGVASNVNIFHLHRFRNQVDCVTYSIVLPVCLRVSVMDCTAELQVIVHVTMIAMMMKTRSRRDFVIVVYVQSSILLINMAAFI